MRIPILAAVMAGLVSLAALPGAGAQEAATIAVLELATKDLQRETMLQYIDLLSGALFRTGAFTVIDGGRRDDALREIEFSASAAADRAAQIEAGRQLAASLVVAGSLGSYDGKLVASLRAVETATGKVAGSADEVYDDIEELFDGAASIARTLFRAVPGARAPRMPASEEGLRPASAPPEGGPAEPDDPLADLAPLAAPAFTPLQVSLFAPLQMAPAKSAVYGLRINLGYADNAALVGMDLGIVNRIAGSATGIQAGIVNHSGSILGLQLGVVNAARTARILQAAAVYNGADSVIGTQLGLVNAAEKCMGLQIGLVNVAGILKGVQVGLVNVVRYGEWAGFMPLVNARF